MKWGLISLILLVACTTAKTSAQKVYQIEGDYAAALVLAVKYEKLPTCNSVTSTHICSDPKIVKIIKQTDVVAWNALQLAQATVRSSDTNTKTEEVILTAENSVKTLLTIVSQLGVN